MTLHQLFMVPGSEMVFCIIIIIKIPKKRCEKQTVLLTRHSNEERDDVKEAISS